MRAEFGSEENAGRRGSALVEGALILLTLVTMITAILDFGQLLMFAQLFTDRARAGARYAAVNAYDPVKIKNFVCYNTPSPGDSATGLFGLQPSMVQVDRADANTVDDRIKVSIENYPLAFYSPLLKGSYTHRPFKVVIPVQSLGATN